MRNILNVNRILNFYKQPNGVAILVIIAIIITIYFIYDKYGGIYGIEGMAAGQPTTIADADPNLKCSGLSATTDPTKCESKDMMKLAYDIASDPRLSLTEYDAMAKIFTEMKVDTLFQKFYFDVVMLRASTMFNTTANEKIFKDILMPKTKSDCYGTQYMRTIKDMETAGTGSRLSASQSEIIRCYAHRFNAFRKCMNACK